MIYNKLGQLNYTTKDPENIKEYIYTYRYSGKKFIYIGQLKDGTNEAEGVGIRVFSNGAIEEGEWKNGKLNGYGRVISYDGGYYIGGWKDNNAQGYGEFYYSNGDVYKGNWVNGNKEGQGTMTYNDGTVQSGLWKRGEFKG